MGEWQIEKNRKTERLLLSYTKYKCIDYLRNKRIDIEISLENLSDIICSENNQIQEEDIEPLLLHLKITIKNKKSIFIKPKNRTYL